MEAPNDAFLCPITLELFRDPVVADDGHTYERKAIEEWIRKNGTSPMTKQKISLEHLRTNYAIKKAVDHFEASLRGKNFQYTLDVDVKKKKGRPLFQTYGKTIYHAEWLPTNAGRPEIILLKIDGARANKEASFYVDLSRHPHIVRTFGLVRENGDDRNSITLLQEYATEGSLYELLTERKEPLDEKILIEIFLQIIDAMSYLALNNVVHGDLACRNVLVFRFDEKNSKNIVVKVTDFGLSRHSKIYNQVATVARTTLDIIPVRYSAPEILSTGVTANDYTEKSDVYAMGVLMWEAYSRGVIPWANIQNDNDVVRRVRNGDMLPQPANCSPHYWDIITKTWSQLPTQRPTFDQIKKLFKDQLYPTTMSASKPNIPSSKQSNVSAPSLYQDNPSGLPRYMYAGNANDNNNASNPSNVRNQSNVSGQGQGASSISKNQSATSESSQHDQMMGKVVQFGKDSSTIKAYISCRKKQLFALECERPIVGYDGKCPECGQQHLMLAKSRGFYVSVDSVYDLLVKQTMEKERLQGRKTVEKLEKVKDNLPPLDHPILGQNKGIEGDSNSCYMDATIFCMFAYSGVFDSLLHMDIHNKGSLENLQQLLRENIVNVLRSKTGFVERDALFYLRDQLSEATGDRSFKEMEKDPSEFLRALEKLFPYAPLKTIPPNQPPNANGSNVTTNIMWEMFDGNPDKLHSTNIASIFRNSLSEIPAKLATIPPFLILVAPRHARSQRSYRYIIPDREITLDNEIVQLVCFKCSKTNHGSDQPREFYFCNKCYLKEASSSSTPSTDAAIICYCSGCLEKLHARVPEKERCEHDLNIMKTATYKLNLFAVLCIETSHYVAFVKCHKTEQKYEWIFFDNASDRIQDEKNVPRVSTVFNLDECIAKADAEKDNFFKDLDRRRDQGKPTSQAFSEDEMRLIRLFRDGAFFFYENSAVNYQ